MCNKQCQFNSTLQVNARWHLLVENFLNEYQTTGSSSYKLYEKLSKNISEFFHSTKT